MMAATANTKLNRFEQLNSINVGDKTEKKNGLTYLSWAWAWAELKKRFPNSFYTVYETEKGINYFTDGKTCWVKTGVTLVDGDFSLEHVEYLPVMDFKNRSIPLDSITSMDVNKAIQRSLTKACARHGIGLYIYAGEDLPEETEAEKQQKAEQEELRKALLARIDAAVRQRMEGKTAAEKQAFAKEVLVPALGVANYKLCNDVKKLEALAAQLAA
jgi:hypothetical protein